MVQIDVPVAFAIGTVFADAARRQLQTGRPEHYYRAWVQNNLFQSFFFSWIPVYFILNYFGWETTHMWWHEDAAAAYPFFVPLFLVIFFAAANGGFLVGYRLIRNGTPNANRIIYLGIFLYSAIWIFAQTNSTFRLGSYSQWQSGAAPWFYQDATFLAMLIFSLLVWGIGLALFIRCLVREGRELSVS